MTFSSLSASEPAPQAASQVTSAPAAVASQALAITVDESQPTTKLRINLANGTKYGVLGIS